MNRFFQAASAAFLLCAISCAARAQSANPLVVSSCNVAKQFSSGQAGSQTVDTYGNLCSSALFAANSSTGGFTAVTVGTTSAQVLAAATSRKLLAIGNQSATASISCAFGATAALNTAGSFMIGPQQILTWNGSYIPADAVNCIASAASTPATMESN